jgi:fibronectin type 3 domain-containing protein
MPKPLLWMPLLVLALALAGCEDNTAAPAAGKPHAATLTWNASTTPVLGYHVYRATDPNVQPGLVAVTKPDVTQYVDRSVQPGRTYYYSVKSVGANGAESASSEKVSATIPTD